ncbi:MAG: SemiSWEET transporter [Croceitalea sp.]|nr:SemiSWEET transporter [Croceitalea sp.]MBT8238881.1 SemiSWEET transporter [Croceitalea sp.]NNC34594.1 SemiSWEET transporter [Croceitalea sp.]NNL09227.1 SemiSWEET transporter [Croceitalea sp.]NNM17298.1 SemiSWEET transporter [Croceitalea sp.]
MPTIELIGLIAATLTTSAFVPQVYKAFKNKSTADISMTMYAVLLAGLILWTVYGIYHKSLAIILANTITGALAIVMIILKIKHK